MGVLGAIAKHLDTIIGVPFWGYMKLLFCMWLVFFNGAAYIYGNIVRKYVKIGNYMMVNSNYPESQRKVLEMMSLDARNSVEQYIDRYGPDAFERVIKAMMSLDARNSVEQYIDRYGPDAFERVIKAAEKEAKKH
ncbi:hypothetical protein G4B88_007222 [Cannabis sativa]|uniref:HVA22-like protein n=1 Tax=Cannabis sativa TaxID=3483 RepID=A0A7J6FTS0_CANSA|nr:hypothetical protein G4B88_007222 [Cannabis sativa]